MKKGTGSWLILILFMCAGQNTLLSQMTIKGRVTENKSGNALPGAAVTMKLYTLGAYTTASGDYRFIVPEEKRNESVVISAKLIGYKEKTQKIMLSQDTITVNFDLFEDVFQSEEVVVTGIASKTEKSVAEVAVSRIDAENLQEINTYSNLNQLVSGKISGVQVLTSSGNIGSGWQFFVRGGGGLNGDGQPVIYIDGTRVENTEIADPSGSNVGGQSTNTLANLNPNDIEKIEVLKGPAAASMYGADGSNGVVLITTKSAKLAPGGDGVAVQYSFNYGWNEQLTKYSKEKFVNADVANAQFLKGQIRDHYLSLAGGSPALRYFASFNSRYEEGAFPLVLGDRSNVRLNVTSVPTEKVSLKLSAGYTKNKITNPHQDNSAWGILGNTLLVETPWFFVSERDIRKVYEANYGDEFIGSAAGTYLVTPHLEVKGLIGINQSAWRQEMFIPYGSDQEYIGQTGIYDRMNRQMTYEWGVSYSYRLFGEVQTRSMIGGQFFDKQLKSAFVIGQEYATPLIYDLASAGTIVFYNDYFRPSRSGGLYTEHAFDYQEQYFLTLGLRKDYATTFGANTPSILYPKASMAVRVDKYPFIPSDIIQLLKVRAAYGETGVLPGVTDGVGLYWTALVSAYGAGGVPTVQGNPSIEPERIKEIEFGFETELLHAVNVEFTYYMQKATNSIIDLPIARSNGMASTQPFNIGAVDISGFETMVQVTPFRGENYGLQLGMIWNYQTNEVKKLGRAPIVSDNNVIQEGKPKYEFMAYTSTASFDSNGAYAGAVRSAEKVDLGNPIPKYTGSCTIEFRFLKNFTLYAFSEWAIDQKRFNYTEEFAAKMGGNAEFTRMQELLGIAAPSDPSVVPLAVGSAEYRAVAEKYAKKNPNYDGNYIEDADWFTIRELSLSYNCSDLLRNTGSSNYIKGLTIGASVRNLLRSTKYSGADVETNERGSRSITIGQEFLTLETPRTFNFWIKLGF